MLFRTLKWTSGCMAALLLVAMLVLMLLANDSKRVGIAVCGKTLTYILHTWEQNGSPENVHITNYIFYSTDNYLVYTNMLIISGKPLKCQFACKSPRFNNKGFLAITRDNRLFWIDRSGKASLMTLH